MKKSASIITVLLLIISTYSNAQEIAQWRGDNRDGKYDETSLLKNWPDGGPELLWHYDELGPGHASAAVTNKMIFTAGTTDEGNGFVIALSHSGKKIWKTEYGKEWVENWDGVRSTPLIYNGKVYIMSSYGELVCMNAETGSIIWDVNLFSDYDGINIKWGVTENLLIDGDHLFVTPGGIKDNVIALNKDDGSLVWTSEGNGELSAYCSPMIINRGGIKILVTQTTNSILGIDASNGNLLWNHDQPNKWSVHPNTPLYSDGSLFIVSGYGKGNVKLGLSEDGKTITELWRNESLDNKMGGVILLDGKLYGSGDANKSWFCIDWETGEDLYLSKMLKPGNIIFADGMLYCYGNGGDVGIVDPKTNDFSLKGSFSVPYGEKYHWAHLVIHNKKLYVRHGTSLMVYNIRKE